MIELGIADLAHVVQQRRELEVAPLARAAARARRRHAAQLDHVTAVHAGVGVVGLDHVAEQEGGAAVGVAELELVVDPNPALAREDREQADQRQREHHAVRRGLGRKGHGEPDRSKACVDHVDGRHRTQVVLRRHAERDPLTGGGDGEVERELRGERRQVERPLAERRRPFAGEPEHERRADRVRGVQQAQDEALEVQRPSQALDRAREQHAGRDGERHPAGRQQKQHRDENQLGRHRGTAADLELEPEGRGVRADQHQHRAQTGVPVGREVERQRRGAGDEGGREDGERPQLAPRQALEPADARLLDHPLLVGIEDPRARGR